MLKLLPSSVNFDLRQPNSYPRKPPWNQYDDRNKFGRTFFWPFPPIQGPRDDRYVRLALHTYNKRHKGYFEGVTLYSDKERFNLPRSRNSAIEFSATLRLVSPTPRGIVRAFFVQQKVAGDNEEIDFEFLSNFLQPRSERNRNYLWLNVLHGGSQWLNNEGFYDESKVKIQVDNVDWSKWNSYKIRWTKTNVEWLIRPHNKTDFTPVNKTINYSPSGSLAVFFQIWVPSQGADGSKGDFNQAYSSTIKATLNPRENRAYFLDVKSMSVSSS